MKKVVLTGAGGALGTKLYPLLRRRYALTLTDLQRPAWCPRDQPFVAADLRDTAALRTALRGADALVHFGAIGHEDDWASLLAVSIDGTFNVFEAARLEGVERVVYASSVHAIGYYSRARRLGVDERVRPDSRYGISKCCGEAIASFYADKYRLKVLTIRIGNGTFDRPNDERLLSIWVSARDLAQLVSIGIEHPQLRCEIVYGVSGNTRSFWDNGSATRLGYVPEDNAEEFAEEVLRAGPVEDPSRPGSRYQGGYFIELP